MHGIYHQNTVCNTLALFQILTFSLEYILGQKNYVQYRTFTQGWYTNIVKCFILINVYSIQSKSPWLSTVKNTLECCGLRASGITYSSQRASINSFKKNYNNE